MDYQLKHDIFTKTEREGIQDGDHVVILEGFDQDKLAAANIPAVMNKYGLSILVGPKQIEAKGPRSRTGRLAIALRITGASFATELLEAAPYSAEKVWKMEEIGAEPHGLLGRGPQQR